MLFYFNKVQNRCYRGIAFFYRGITARFRGIITHFRGITPLSRNHYPPPRNHHLLSRNHSPLPRNHSPLPWAWNYYLIAFNEACLYNVFLGAKPTWHGRNIRVTPKNAITARICWAFFVL